MPACLTFENKQVGAATGPDKQDMTPLGDAYQTCAPSFTGQESGILCTNSSQDKEDRLRSSVYLGGQTASAHREGIPSAVQEEQ